MLTQATRLVMVKRCRINLPTTLKAAIQAEPWVEMAADMCLLFLPAYWDCSPTPPFIRFKVIVALFLPLNFTHVGTDANPFRAIAEGQPFASVLRRSSHT